MIREVEDELILVLCSCHPGLLVPSFAYASQLLLQVWRIWPAFQAWKIWICGPRIRDQAMLWNSLQSNGCRTSLTSKDWQVPSFNVIVSRERQVESHHPLLVMGAGYDYACSTTCSIFATDSHTRSLRMTAHIVNAYSTRAWWQILQHVTLLSEPLSSHGHLLVYQDRKIQNSIYAGNHISPRLHWDCWARRVHAIQEASELALEILVRHRQ